MQIINRMHNQRSSYQHLRGLVDLLCELPPWVFMEEAIEIGCFTGDSTVLIALPGFSHVTTIDPLGGTPDWLGTHGLSSEAVEGQLRRNIAGKRITHLKMTSDEAAKLPWKNRVSFVYIDGFHSYEQCKKDIQNYWPLLTDNGFMCGHDYGNEDTPGVTQAVQELFGEPDKLFLDWSWLVQKTPTRMRNA